MRLLDVTLPVAVGLMSVMGGAAHAETFGEVQAGIANPIGNSDWTNLVSTSFKLAGRLGFTVPQGIGAALQLDWTPININGNTLPGVDVSAYRIRLLPNFVYHHPIAPKVDLSARVGIGIDYVHESVTALNTTSTTSDTAFAFELGGGLWYDVGSVELGGELALPISSHSDKNGANYSSYDIDILVGVRFTGGRGR